MLVTSHFSQFDILPAAVEICLSAACSIQELDSFCCFAIETSTADSIKTWLKLAGRIHTYISVYTALIKLYAAKEWFFFVELKTS